MIQFFIRRLKKSGKPSAGLTMSSMVMRSGEIQTDTGIWRNGLRPGWIRSFYTHEEWFVTESEIEKMCSAFYQYLETEAMLYEKANR